MTTFDIKMPKLGESITEGTIVAWSVKVSDAVKEDDILFEVTTAKVNAEIPSPVEGTVLKILFSEGDTVSVGTVVLVMQIEGENTGEQDTSPDTSLDTIEIPPMETKEEKWYSPVVLRLANEANIPMDELDKIQGNGYLGRLSKKDIQRYITQKKDGVNAPSVTVAKKNGTCCGRKGATTGCK